MKVDEAITKYIELRDQRDARKKEHADEIRKRFTEPMNRIEAAFLKHFDKSGSDSIKRNGVGVAYLTHRVSDKVTDRQALFDFVVHNDAFALLESRVNKTAVDEYVQEHEDLPPGVNRTIEQRVNVRRG